MEVRCSGDHLLLLSVVEMERQKGRLDDLFGILVGVDGLFDDAAKFILSDVLADR